MKIAAIQEAFKQAGTLATAAAAAATATSTAPTQCDTISTKSEQCIVATEDTPESADSSKKTTPRKMSCSPRQLSIGDSQAAALALAGAAVTHAAAAFLHNPCQNSAEYLSPNAHDSPGTITSKIEGGSEQWRSELQIHMINSIPISKYDLNYQLLGAWFKLGLSPIDDRTFTLKC